MLNLFPIKIRNLKLHYRLNSSEDSPLSPLHLNLSSARKKFATAGKDALSAITA
jgi:hypothetical protein